MFKPSLKIASLAICAALSLGTLSAAHADNAGERGRSLGHEQSFRGHDMHRVSSRHDERHMQHARQSHHSHHSHHQHHGRTHQR